jgi:hypothetical protein
VLRRRPELAQSNRKQHEIPLDQFMAQSNRIGTTIARENGGGARELQARISSKSVPLPGAKAIADSIRSNEEQHAQKRLKNVIRDWGFCVNIWIATVNRDPIQGCY